MKPKPFVNNRLLVSFALFFWVAASLHAQLGSPKIGVVRYADNSLHSVTGLHNNLIVAAEPLGSALSASFSDAGGLIAKSGQIQLLGPDSSIIGECSSSDPDPVVNIDSGLTSAIAWLPSENALLHWNGAAFVRTPVTTNLAGVVTAIRLDTPDTAKLLLTEKAGVSEATISLSTGNLVTLNLIPAVTGAAFAQGYFILYHDEHGLEIASRTGSIRTLALNAPDLTIERMSSDWLHLSSVTAKEDWVLHLTTMTLELSQLPAPPSAHTESTTANFAEVH